jgi:hypothetical protein
MQSETGESTQAINQRADDEAQWAVFSALRDGATLRAHLKLERAAVEGLAPDDKREGRTISFTRLRQLEAEGHIKQVGMDQYKLAREMPADHGLVFHEDPGHGWLAVPVDRYPEALECSTGYGYFKDGIAYLEEDSELSKFMRRHPEFDLNRVPTKRYDDEAPLRWFPSLPAPAKARPRRSAVGMG